MLSERNKRVIEEIMHVEYSLFEQRLCIRTRYAEPMQFIWYMLRPCPNEVVNSFVSVSAIPFPTDLGWICSYTQFCIRQITIF